MGVLGFFRFRFLFLFRCLGVSLENALGLAHRRKLAVPNFRGKLETEKRASRSPPVKFATHKRQERKRWSLRLREHDFYKPGKAVCLVAKFGTSFRRRNERFRTAPAPKAISAI